MNNLQLKRLRERRVSAITTRPVPNFCVTCYFRLIRVCEIVEDSLRRNFFPNTCPAGKGIRRDFVLGRTSACNMGRADLLATGSMGSNG